MSIGNKEIRELRRGMGREYCNILNASEPQAVIEAYGRVAIMRQRLKQIDPLAEDYTLPITGEDYLVDIAELETQLSTAQGLANEATTAPLFLDRIKEVNRLKKIIAERKKAAGGGSDTRILRKV